ncbi:hypothetical protein [Herbaspirillum huttiense]|uniref:hypothetical protein n=1 Tax=Herbaspirillum huttiense TaxID=863372 RepID=UPI0031D8540F
MDFPTMFATTFVQFSSEGSKATLTTTYSMHIIVKEAIYHISELENRSWSAAAHMRASGNPSLRRLLVAATLLRSYEMSIESKLATRENETPAQSAFDATVKKPRNGNVENRETDTDSASKEIAKPLETDHIPEQAKKTDGGYSALGIRSNSPQAS